MISDWSIVQQSKLLNKNNELGDDLKISRRGLYIGGHAPIGLQQLLGGQALICLKYPFPTRI